MKTLISNAIRYFFHLSLLLSLFSVPAWAQDPTSSKKEVSKSQVISLPQPKTDSNFSLEKSISKRRSIRHYLGTALSLEEVSQLLWAAQGITQGRHRSIPSAGARYPLEIYLVVRIADSLSPGVYKYLPQEHSLVTHLAENKLEEVHRAALGQEWVKQASVVLVIAANYRRTTQKYKRRGVRYVHIEVGHSAQNVYLQAQALGLATCEIGAFSDKKIKQVLNLPQQEHPLALLPIGRPNPETGK